VRQPSEQTEAVHAVRRHGADDRELPDAAEGRLRVESEIRRHEFDSDDHVPAGRHLVLGCAGVQYVYSLLTGYFEDSYRLLALVALVALVAANPHENPCAEYGCMSAYECI